MTAPRIRDLGPLSGTILLFGGAYSNLQALDALLGLGVPPERAIFTGDVVAYGADALACAERLADYGCPAILGNCEAQLLAGASECGCGFESGTACDIAAKTWFEHASNQIGPRAQRFWADTPDWLTFTHGAKRYAVIHGGARDIARFIWPSDPDEMFEAEFTTIEAQTGPIDGVIAGHCGIAFERRIGARHWINAGVIGMPPHDGRPEARYATLADDGIRFHSLSYDFKAAARAMEVAGLTQGYETALRTGLWPSEDVLPRPLRR
ncbi:metallophosphoesterase family protein [Litoreibacter ponti]|nr:metallophosphoesterase family protein [Litoreibacter ponti]